MNTKLVALITASCILLGAAPLPKIEINAGQLSLHTQDSSLGEVLASISKQAGISTIFITGSGVVSHEKINDDFTLPLEQGIKRLLHGWNYALISDKTPKAPQQLFILGKEGDDASSGAPVTLPAPEILPAAQLDVSKEAVAKAVEDQAARQQGSVTGKNPTAAEVVTARLGLQSAVPADRLAAVATLDFGNVDDNTLQTIRQMAENDSDPAVRAAALDQMMRNDPSPQSAEVLTHLAGGPSSEARDQVRQYLQQNASAPAILASTYGQQEIK